MTNLILLILAIIIGVPLTDFINRKRAQWEEYQRDMWMPRHPSNKEEQP